MNDIVKPAAQWVAGRIPTTALIVLFLFSLFFEIKKVKIAPFTALFKWIGNAINSRVKADIADLKAETNAKIDRLQEDTDGRLSNLEKTMNTRLDEIRESSNANDVKLEQQLHDIEERQDSQAAARIKAHVLNFSRSLRNGEKHTEEDFKNLVKENEEYEALVKKYEWVNHVYVEDYAFFLQKYREAQDKNDFLR